MSAREKIVDWRWLPSGTTTLNQSKRLYRIGWYCDVFCTMRNISCRCDTKCQVTEKLVREYITSYAMAYIKSDSSARSRPNGESDGIVTDARITVSGKWTIEAKRVTAPNVRGPFRVFVLSSNESNKTKKKQCDKKSERMRRESADIERERMYRQMGRCL